MCSSRSSPAATRSSGSTRPSTAVGSRCASRAWSARTGPWCGWPRRDRAERWDARGRGGRRTGLDRRTARRSASPSRRRDHRRLRRDQATIGGPLARLDSRFVEGLAGSLVAQGLDRLDARLQARPDVRHAGRESCRERRGAAVTVTDLSPSPIASRSAGPRRPPRPDVAGDGGRHRRHAAHQRGHLAARGGHGVAAGRPGGLERADGVAAHRGHDDPDPARGPGRYPDAPRRGAPHGQLGGPQPRAPSAGTCSRRRPAAIWRSPCSRSMRP